MIGNTDVWAAVITVMHKILQASFGGSNRVIQSLQGKGFAGEAALGCPPHNLPGVNVGDEGGVDESSAGAHTGSCQPTHSRLGAGAQIVALNHIKTRMWCFRRPCCEGLPPAYDAVEPSDFHQPSDLIAANIVACTFHGVPHCCAPPCTL